MLDRLSSASETPGVLALYKPYLLTYLIQTHLINWDEWRYVTDWRAVRRSSLYL